MAGKSAPTIKPNAGTSGAPPADAPTTIGSTSTFIPPASEWLDFTELARPPHRTTRVIGVYRKGTDTLLGVISWWHTWRQYTLLPPVDDLQYVYAAGCLRDIVACIEGLMAERRGG